MRITQGRLKGRKLLTPPDQITRPTKGMVKEALFNKIRDKVENASFLDLFAGSGSIGIEAISLGSKATFVERHPSALKALRHNIEALEIRAESTLLSMDVFRSLCFLEKNGHFFSVIFADPPYEEKKSGSSLFLDEAVIEAIDQKAGLLDQGGMLIVESRRSLEKTTLRHLLFSSSRKYGDSYLNFFER
jgi:16S rRNA (guanine966-N2)-methyltransferase